MLSSYDEASAREVLNQPLDPALRKIITDQVAKASSRGLNELTQLVVVQPGDTEATLLDELGWSPLVNPITEARYGEPHFEPFWAWLQALGGWYELIHTVGNSGFAYILLIQKQAGVPANLLAMCRRYTRDGQ
jgi:hypothetical protein